MADEVGYKKNSEKLSGLEWGLAGMVALVFVIMATQLAEIATLFQTRAHF